MNEDWVEHDKSLHSETNSGRMARDVVRQKQCQELDVKQGLQRIVGITLA